MQSPHDTLFHHVFRNPARAVAWVQSVLPERLPPFIDWQTFQPANARITGLRLREHQADLVFSADLLGCGHLVLFVIEHKSGPDPDLHWQMLRYSVHLAHATRRRHGTLPQIVPLALTHGGTPILTTGWNNLPAEVATALAPFQPHIDVRVDDLSACSEAELVDRDLPAVIRLTLLCLQHTRGRSADELLAAIDRWRAVLREVERDAADTAADALDEIGWYLVDTSDLTEDQVRMAFHKHLDQPEHAPMTTGQRIRIESRNLGREEGRREGEAAGEARGETKAKTQTLLHQLRRRFPDTCEPFVPRIQTATMQDLDRWLDRILDAKTAADVFVD